MEFHQNLKFLREKSGMTQEELAEQLGITRQSVSKWELGINEPDLPTIRALCKILGCSYNALLGEEEIGVQENVSAPQAEPKAEKAHIVYMFPRWCALSSILSLVCSSPFFHSLSCLTAPRFHRSFTLPLAEATT